MEFKTGQLYRTRDGRKAQIFMLDNGDEYMIGAVQQSDGTWTVQTWPKCGTFSANLCVNLVSEWREPIERKIMAWVGLREPSADSSNHLLRLGIDGVWWVKTEVCQTKVEIIVREVPE